MGGVDHSELVVSFRQCGTVLCLQSPIRCRSVQPGSEHHRDDVSSDSHSPWSPSIRRKHKSENLPPP